MALADVQQKNVTAADAAAAHAEAPLTAQFLEPVDGRVMCADNFAVGKSPVNLALTKLRQLVAGLRGAVLGDFAGAVPRSFRSISVDSTGGSVYTASPGSITATDNIRTVTGNLIVDAGSVYTNGGDFETQHGRVIVDDSNSYINVGVAGERGFLTSRKAIFTGTLTGASGSNPPQGTAIPNELRAVNIPKGFCCVRMAAPNTITSFDGGGVSSVAFGLGGMVFNLAHPFLDQNFTVLTGTLINTASGFAFPEELVASRTNNTVVIKFSTAVGVAINPILVAIDGFSIGFFGKQTT